MKLRDLLALPFFFLGLKLIQLAVSIGGVFTAGQALEMLGHHKKS